MMLLYALGQLFASLLVLLLSAINCLISLFSR